MPRSLRQNRGIAVSALTAALFLVAAFPGRPAQAADTVKVTGRLAGRTFPASAGNPIVLGPDRPILFEVAISNDGSEAVEVRTITLAGRVTALTFFSYQTSVAISVPPHATVTREYSLDLAGLKYQATGLFNARITLLDQQRRPIVSRPMAVDVRGSWRSVYVVFGLILAAGTVASFVLAVRELARHRLSSNRWRRGLRFMIPGIGLALTLIFTSSAFRLYLFGPLAWLPVLLISTAAFFAVGYLTPNPDEADPTVGTRQREYAEAPGPPRL